MIEIQIRRPCSKPEPELFFKQGMPGARCPECGEWTLRADRRIDHLLVVEWRPARDVLAMVQAEGM